MGGVQEGPGASRLTELGEDCPGVGLVPAGLLQQGQCSEQDSAGLL